MKLALLGFLLLCSALANSVVTFSCQNIAGGSKTLLNGGGFRYFTFESQGGSCGDSNGTISFICGASEFKCGSGCLVKVLYEHQPGA